MAKLDKRKIPRHVDGRIMVGKVHVKNFFILLPLSILLIFLAYSLNALVGHTPLIMFVTVILIGILYCMFSEFNYRETGFDMIINAITYLREGDIYFERSCKNIATYKRRAWNKIEKQEQ